MLKNIFKKKAVIIAGIVAVVLLLIYIGFSIFFMNHFFFRTTINGMDVSGCSVAKVQKKTESSIDEYELTITERDGTTETLKGTDFSLKPEWDDSLNRLLKKQNGFAWFIRLFTKNELTSETLVSYDKDALQQAIRKLPCMEEAKQIEPVDAAISEYSKEDGYTLVPSVPGTAIDDSAMTEAVENALNGLEDALSLEEGGCYKQPAVGDDDEKLLAAIDTLNQYADTTITYEVGDDTQVLDASVFSGWLSVSDEMEPVIDEAQVEEYVSSLADTYNTCYSAKKLATSYGSTVTISKSSYGWKVDKEAEKAQIIEEIQAGEEVTRDLNYSMTANSHGENDYGNSYVEINLTAQHLFLYENGSLILESDFVSGNIANGNGTPTGAYGVTYTEKNATLRGENYATPVSFWMPFAGNVGMHDATWRSSFGGSIYKRSGSHGCINLPYSAAQTIFSHVYAGYPVLVYELPGTESAKGIAQDQAYVVTCAIRDIGDVTLESGAAIASARAQYDALSDTAKGYVTNYDTLTYAEAVYAELVNAQTPAAP